MYRPLRVLAWFCVIAFAGSVLHADEQTKRQPVPDKTAREKAEELVKDIFKDEIANATDADSRTKLAAYLVLQGDETGDDPAAQYVLYILARDLAVQAGDVALTLGTIDKLAGRFELPALNLKALALAQLTPNVPNKEPSRTLAETAMALIGEALESDNYSAAVALGKVATEAAKKSQVVALALAAAKLNTEVEAAQKKFNVLQPFVDQLQKDPDNAEANLKLGEYFGLFKGKWERALPHLAKSKSEPLAGLAKMDLTDPKDARDQAAVADAWWDFAAKQGQPQQARVQERASYWYEKALPGLAGLSRTKAQKRVDQTSARIQGAKPASDLRTGMLAELTGHTAEIRALAISGDGRFGLSGSVDNAMRLWDLAAGKDIQSFKGHTKQVWGVAFVPGGKQVLSASWDGTVKLWEMTTAQTVRILQHPIDANGVTVSRDGKWVLTGCDDKYLRLWDLARGEEVKKYGPHSNFCYAGAFAPNGQLVGSGGADRRGMVYELATGRLVREVEQNNAVQAVAFSPDSKHLFTCGDSAAHMWEIASGKEERRFEAGNGLVTCMGLTPDGRGLVTGGEDKFLRLWDVKSAKEMARFQGHTMTISALAVSADGRRVLSGQIDGNIRYWGLPQR